MTLSLLETTGPGAQWLASPPGNRSLGFRSHLGPQSSQFPFRNPVVISKRNVMLGVGSGLPRYPILCLLPPWLAHPPLEPPTFSSREATLKARSVTLPAAQRAALEECSSFQMVSVSTCGGQSQGPHHPRPPTAARARGAVPTPRPGPQGQGAGQTALPPHCPAAQKSKASRVPQSRHDFSFPASVHITSPQLASTLPAASRLPPGQRRGHGVTWAGLGVWAWRGF